MATKIVGSWGLPTDKIARPPQAVVPDYARPVSPSVPIDRPAPTGGSWGKPFDRVGASPLKYNSNARPASPYAGAGYAPHGPPMAPIVESNGTAIPEGRRVNNWGLPFDKVGRPADLGARYPSPAAVPVAASPAGLRPGVGKDWGLPFDKVPSPRPPSPAPRPVYGVSPVLIPPARVAQVALPPPDVPCVPCAPAPSPMPIGPQPIPMAAPTPQIVRHPSPAMCIPPRQPTPIGSMALPAQYSNGPPIVVHDGSPPYQMSPSHAFPHEQQPMYVNVDGMLYSPQIVTSPSARGPSISPTGGSPLNEQPFYVMNGGSPVNGMPVPTPVASVPFPLPDIGRGYIVEKPPLELTYEYFTREKQRVEKLKKESQSVREAREHEFLRAHKELEALKMQQAIDLSHLESKIREYTLQMDRQRKAQAQTDEMLMRIKAEREAARRRETEAHDALNHRIAELEQQREYAREQEMDEIRKQSRVQTAKAHELANEKMVIAVQQLDEENKRRDAEQAHKMKEQELDMRERRIQAEWEEIERRRSELDKMSTAAELARKRAGAAAVS